MTKEVKKFFNEWKWWVAILGAIAVFYFISRIFRLIIIPVFADEAIYIRWSQVMRAESTLRFLPLSDGKQPLFMWLTIPFLKIFSDPLFAGRMLSVFAGFGAMVGISTLSLLLSKNKPTATLAALLYLFSPFFFFFDRMALVDNLLCALGVWIMVFAFLLTRDNRLDLAMILGLLLGSALLTKSPAIFFVPLIPLALLTRKEKFKKWEWLKYFCLLGVVGFFGLAVYNILRLGPNFQMIAIRNKDYVFSLQEILFHPLHPFIERLKDIFSWEANLLTWPIFLWCLIGIIWRLKRNFKAGLWLLTWWIVPLLAQSQMAKVFTSRYILFTVPPLLIFAAWLLADFFTKKKLSLFLSSLLILLILPAVYIGQLIVAPQLAPLTGEMRSGYLEGWTAGYGIKESAEILRERAARGNVLVGTEGYFGTLPDGLQMYLEKVPNIRVVGVGWPIREIADSLKNSLVDNEVYLVVNNMRLELDPAKNGLKLISEYPKAVQSDSAMEKLLLFKLEKI